MGETVYDHAARLEMENRRLSDSIVALKARADAAEAELAKHEGCVADNAKAFDASLGQCLDRAEKAEAALAAARRECEGLRRALSDACAALALAGQDLVRRLNERREKMSTVDVVNDEVAEAVARAVNAARAALAAPAAGEEGK